MCLTFFFVTVLMRSSDGDYGKPQEKDCYTVSSCVLNRGRVHPHEGSHFNN